MSRELDVVLADLQAVQKQVAEYIASQTDVGRKQKAEDLMEAAHHEIFLFELLFLRMFFKWSLSTQRMLNTHTAGKWTLSVGWSMLYAPN